MWRFWWGLEWDGRAVGFRIALVGTVGVGGGGGVVGVVVLFPSVDKARFHDGRGGSVCVLCVCVCVCVFL